MALQPCSMCDERFKGKPATAYWAWFNPLGVRYAKKQRYDPPCYGQNLRDWVVIADTQPRGVCVKCEEDIAPADMRATYLNLYLPTRDPIELVYEMCDVCTDELRSLASKGAEDLPNRQSALRQDPDKVEDPWAAYS